MNLLINKKFITAVLFVFVTAIGFSEDNIGVSLLVTNHLDETVGYYNEVNPGFTFFSKYFTAVANLSLINDGKYQADIANFSSGDLLGYYSVMNSGYVEFNYGDFYLTVGQKQHEDFIDSDYSLFISGNKNPAFIGDFVYDGELFYYETRWTRLNERSAIFLNDDGDSLDRGANYKTYALKLGKFRLGFQDAAVYLDRSFDLEYFVNPLPQYFIQYTKIGDGRPWETESNENNLIGAFLDYTDDTIYAYGQYLMDDFNLHWLLPDTGHNPNKMAYAVGCKVDSAMGRFSFDAALAFKYTFQATYANESYSDYPYEYTYYPSSTFDIAGEEQTIDYIDNYLGYKYGENNLAVQAGYENALNITDDIPLDYTASLEYVVSGSKSPSNPWNELSWHENEGTKFLDDDVLEHTIKAVGECRAVWKGFSASLGLTLGYVFNELALTEVVAGEAGIFVPQEGDNHWLFDIALSLGYRYTF